MSYQIAGRAIKNEHITLATYGLVGGLVWALSGGKKATEAPKPSKGQSLVDAVKEAVPLKAGSSEEEQFIKNYIAQAEKEV